MIDYTHDMFMPDRRAPRIVPPQVVPDRDGTHEEKELWMREHMRRKKPPRRSPPTARSPQSLIAILLKKEKGEIINAMAETKKYPVECPDPECAYEWDYAADPEIVSNDDEDAEEIQCPQCLEKWDWEYDDETEEITLLADELTEEDIDQDDDDSGDFEDEDVYDEDPEKV